MIKQFFYNDSYLRANKQYRPYTNAYTCRLGQCWIYVRKWSLVEYDGSQTLRHNVATQIWMSKAKKLSHCDSDMNHALRCTYLLVSDGRTSTLTSSIELSLLMHACWCSSSCSALQLCIYCTKWSSHQTNSTLKDVVNLAVEANFGFKAVLRGANFDANCGSAVLCGATSCKRGWVPKILVVETKLESKCESTQLRMGCHDFWEFVHLFLMPNVAEVKQPLDSMYIVWPPACIFKQSWIFLSMSTRDW